jgi:hypothetical protein
VQRDGEHAQRAADLDAGVLGALGFEVVLRFAQLEAGLLGEQRGDAPPELRMRVETGTDRGASDRQLTEVPEAALDPLPAVAELVLVAAELLAQRQRRGILKVRAAALEDPGELPRLRLQGPLEVLERRQQPLSGSA